MADDAEAGAGGGWLAADVVLFTKRDGVLAVVVVQRGKEPFLGALAVPGGFVEPGERMVDAAVRELGEETGIVVTCDRLRRFGRYRKPGRDPRGPVESVAFHAYVAGAPTPVGRGDAVDAHWVTLAEFFDANSVVAFDHRRVVADAVASRFGFRYEMESAVDVHFPDS
jgi:8-oxo-dGTP diphosphatase